MPSEKQAEARVAAAVAAEQQRQAQIHEAVDAARKRVPSLDARYASNAVVSGKTIDEVKADLVAKMLEPSGREKSKANMVHQLQASGELPADKPEGAPSGRALAKSSMISELQRKGIKPVGT